MVSFSFVPISFAHCIFHLSRFCIALHFNIFTEYYSASEQVMFIWNVLCLSGLNSITVLISAMFQADYKHTNDLAINFMKKNARIFFFAFKINSNYRQKYRIIPLEWSHIFSNWFFFWNVQDIFFRLHAAIATVIYLKWLNWLLLNHGCPWMLSQSSIHFTVNPSVCLTGLKFISILDHSSDSGCIMQ